MRLTSILLASLVLSLFFSCKKELTYKDYFMYSKDSWEERSIVISGPDKFKTEKNYKSTYALEGDKMKVTM